MANQWSLYQHGGARSDTFLPRISEYDEEELSPAHQPDELQGAAMLQEYIDSHPLASSNTPPRQELHSQLLANEMVTPGTESFFLYYHATFLCLARGRSYQTKTRHFQLVKQLAFVVGTQLSSPKANQGMLWPMDGSLPCYVHRSALKQRHDTLRGMLCLPPAEPETECACRRSSDLTQ